MSYKLKNYTINVNKIEYIEFIRQSRRYVYEQNTHADIFLYRIHFSSGNFIEFEDIKCDGQSATLERHYDTLIQIMKNKIL